MYLSRQQKTGSVGPEESKKGTDVVQELEDVDVFAVLLVYQVVVGSSHGCKDCSNLQIQMMSKL